MKSKHVGMGVIVFEDVIDIDQNFLSEYISWLKANSDDTFTYLEEDGIKYAINKTGFKFKLEDIILAPQRFVNTKGIGLGIEVPKKYTDFVDSLESAIYDSIVEYCCYFPDAATTAWWRPNGHIAGYQDGQRIGPHCDDQVPFEWGKITGNQVSMHNSSSINLYLNESVEFEDQLNDFNYFGGEINFPNINYKWRPKIGSVVMYSSGYLGRHEVLPVTAGQRYAYLSVASYGTSFDQGEYVGQPNGNKIWMENLESDYRARMAIKDYSL